MDRHHMQQGYDATRHAGYDSPRQAFGAPYNPPPQIVINNSAAASAAASASVRVRGRQSMLVHVVLFFTTAGIGNLIYWAAKR